MCVGMLCAAVIFAALFWAFPARAEQAGDGARVYDGAGLFDREEFQELTRDVEAFREESGMDLVLVTADDTRGLSSEEYADLYYEQGGFGTGKTHSGALLLLDMDNRRLHVSTTGAMIRFLTDARIETMMDHAIPYIKEGDYHGAASQMIADTAAFYRKGIPDGQYSYNRDTGEVSRHRSIRWYEFLLAFAAAAFTGGAACLNVKRQYAMEREKRQAANYHMAYRAGAHFDYRSQNDALVNKFVTQNVIVRSSAGSGRPGGGGGGAMSTTHTSAGGQTHGGGGRGF